MTTLTEKYLPPVASVLIVIVISSIVKYFTKRKCKKPNGKRGALMSLSIATAFSIVVAATIITKDISTCIACLLLALLLVKTKLDLKQFTNNQIIGSAVTGILVGVIGWFIVDGKVRASSTQQYDRPDLEGSDSAPPKPGMDMRSEADTASSDLDLRTPTPTPTPASTSSTPAAD